MNNAELIKALRWCQTHGCSKCVALLDNGSCKYGGAIKIFEAAADALEAADAKIVKLNTKCADLQSQIYSMENEIEELMPKDGEWQGLIIDGQYWAITCSNCHQVGFNARTPYCPNCGARMRGEQE